MANCPSQNLRKVLGVCAVFVLLLGAGQVSAAPSWSPTAPAFGAPPAATDAPKSVTLITGDRVVVRGKNLEGLSILRAPGREKIRFNTQRVADASGNTRHLYVIPEDAVPLLGRDAVDRRLFDVAQLIEFGYDDAQRANLPLIVTYAWSARQRFTAAARAVPGTVVQADLSIIDGASVTSSKARVHEVWSAVSASGAAARGGPLAAVPTQPIQKLWLDGMRRPILEHSVPQMGAPAAWQLGYEGDGVLVAVLDTGVDDSHPDLSENVIESRNFTIDPDADDVGHGTHVASIIAGSGAVENGRYRGVAPGALLLSGKVCEGLGCPESSILAGMQWAVVEAGAQVVNVSISGPDGPGVDPLEEAINTLSAEFDALFVVAAGNSGPGPYSVESPGSADAALMVGAVDRAADVAYFSSRGLRAGDHVLKPDLAGPGVDIVAARAAGTELGTLVGDMYVAVSGTSMATPHVAGAAALLLEQHPEWGRAELKAALIGSARFNSTWSVADQGAGRVDVAAALGTSLMVDPPSASFGLAAWPHEDDEPKERTLSYRNLGAATELIFELDIVGPGGIRPPPEMFSVTPASLPLAAGASAAVTITANTRVAVPDGIYGGRLIASDGASRRVVVPLAVQREVESYDLTLSHIDRDGLPADQFSTFVSGLDNQTFEFFGQAEGSNVTLRLVAGEYAVQTTYYDVELEEPTILFAPGVRVRENVRMDLDARVAEPVALPVPAPDAALTMATLIVEVLTPIGGMSSFIGLVPGENPLYYSATLGAVPPQFVSALHVQWDEPTATPPAVHVGAWIGRDHLPESPLAPFTRRKTAVVHAEYAASLPSPMPGNELAIYTNVDGMDGYALWYSILNEMPHRRTEYYFSDDESTRWINELWMYDPESSQSILFGWVPRSYRPGRAQVMRWNRPSFAAILPDETILGPTAARAGDVIDIHPAMYADGDGHAGYIVNEGRTVLYRNGEPIVDSPYGGDGGTFEVPPERADYRLELDHAQTMFELTTRQRIVWSFESEHVEGEEPLPLLMLRYAPELDERGRARRGRDFCMPIHVQRFGSPDSPRVREPSLDVSHDDGATWTRAKVERDGQHWKAQFDHPRGAEYVSLRAKARDRDGNGIDHTIIRAYALAERRGSH